MHIKVNYKRIKIIYLTVKVHPSILYPCEVNDMEKDILNLEEACEFLSVSERTLIKLLREEHLPARKIGREWRFGRQALINWISSGDSSEHRIHTIMLMVSGKDTILNIAVGMIVVSIAIIMRGVVPAAVGMQPCLRTAFCSTDRIARGSRSAVM